MTTVYAVFGTPPRFGHSRASNCSAVEINRWKIVTMRVKRYQSFARTFLLLTEILRTGALPSLPHLVGGKNKVLIPQGLEVQSGANPAGGLPGKVQTVLRMSYNRAPDGDN
jgi:hypothetical protein